MLRKSVIFMVLLVFLAIPAKAQDYFGQNKMAYEKLNNYYESDHFKIYHSLDLEDLNQKSHFETQIIHPLENAYRYLSGTLHHSLEHKIPVLAYKTHSGFEGNYIIDSPFASYCRLNASNALATVEFLPEGVGAFAEPTRNRMVLKLDFLPPLNATIIAHELAHIFQFDMLYQGFLGRLTGIQLPGWFIEGGADFMANEYNPYTRDDIRAINQRIAGGNPEKYLLTWEAINGGEGDAYSMGAMFFQFIRDKFGKDIVIDFIITRLKSKQRVSLLEILGQLVDKKNKKLSGIDATEKASKTKKTALSISPQTFDRLNREYWAGRYAKDMRERPTPYSSNNNFESWPIVPEYFPYPTVSAVPSCDGKKMFALSVQKSNIAVISFAIKQKGEVLSDPTAKQVENITPVLPPKPVEYIVAQELNVWPFNGSDLSVSCDGKKIAVFARVGRDHALTLWDTEKRELIDTIDIRLDQGFTPFFSPDGKKIYFSASQNVTRSIYVYDFDLKSVKNLTSTDTYNGFSSAPAVSPDGTKIVYIKFVGDFQKIFLLDLDKSENIQLTFGRYNDNSPSWSEDGKTILYTSDEESGIWNVYTLELSSGLVSQRTNFFGGAFTPKFVPGKPDHIFYSAYWQYDQYRTLIYPNFEVFEAQLKVPVRQYRSRLSLMAENENMDYAFQPDDLFHINVDRNQTLNPQKAPANFKLYGRQANLGYGQYFGMWGSAALSMSNIFENEHYFFRLVSFGSFKVYDGAYLNQKNRLNWGYAGYYQKLPLRYAYYRVSSFGNFKAPPQFILNQTWSTQKGADFLVHYPIDKFSRFESALRFKNRSFLSEYGLTVELINDLGLRDYFTDSDIELLKLYNRAQGSSMSFVGAYVRDTGVDSYDTWGPLNGNRLRAQVEFAPPVGKLLGYTSLSVDARKYFCLGSCRDSLFAVRGHSSVNSNPASGDITLSEVDELRGFPYGSFIGNQTAYGSAELRFPLGLVGINFIGLMPIRGTIFADAGGSRFSSNKSAGQKGSSVGFVMQIPIFGIPFNYGYSWTSKDGFKDRRVVNYVKFSF